ncbi:MAG: phosphate regulon sensor histidine kinase PhoR [Chromatiales bacterium]
MQADLWRVIFIALTATFFGLISGHLLICWLVAALLYAAWQQRQLMQLLRWVRDRKQFPAPDVEGVFEAICREVDYHRSRHRRRKRKLTTLLNELQDATAALPDATVILGRDNEILWANAAAVEFLGIRWPEDLKQRLSNLVRHPQVAQLLAHAAPEEQVVEIPSPSKPDTCLSLQVVPYAEGQRLFVARDVTRLVRLSQMRSDFVANVSHELRTPLTVVSGYVQTLCADERNCPEAWRPLLAQVQAQTDRMTSMIQDLLLIARLENDRSPAPSEQVAIAELVRRVHAEAQTLGGDSRHLFYLEIDPDLQILGDEKELYSAFSNIVTNAVRYTPPRGIIRIKWCRHEGGARFSVEDNGIGIPPQHVPRITERFYRVDAGRSRDSGGTGLGLSIVKHVLNRHGATLQIDSTLGKGSVFCCDFPPARISVLDQAELA